MRDRIALAALCVIGLRLPAVAAKQRTSVPRIASILGVRVGASGQKTLERRLGKEWG